MAPPQQQQALPPGRAVATTIMGGTATLAWSLDQGIIFGSNKCFYCSVPSPPLPNLLDTHHWGMNDKLALPRSRLPCSISNRDGKLFSPEGIPMAHIILPSTMTIFLNEGRHFLPVGNVGINTHHDASARRPILIAAQDAHGPARATRATSSATSATTSTTSGSSSTALVTTSSMWRSS